MHVPNISSVSDICYNCVYLSVAKVDLDVGLSSEEERASAGAMTTSASKLAAALLRRTRKVMSAHVHGPRVGPRRAAPESTACSPTLSPCSRSTLGFVERGQGSSVRTNAALGA